MVYSPKIKKFFQLEITLMSYLFFLEEEIVKTRRVACLLIFSFLFLFSGSSMGADKVDEAGWSHNVCFGYIYALTKMQIKNSKLMKKKSQCGAPCLKILKTNETNLAFLDTWKSKLINHLGADANTFGENGEFSFNAYMLTQQDNILEKSGQAWQGRLAKHNKGVGHCWSKVIIPTLQKLQ